MSRFADTHADVAWGRAPAHQRLAEARVALQRVAPGRAGAQRAPRAENGRRGQHAVGVLQHAVVRQRQLHQVRCVRLHLPPAARAREPALAWQAAATVCSWSCLDPASCMHVHICDTNCRSEGTQIKRVH